ncbi:MAG: immunoglobulin domain-containing protein, partial [Candidatus Acidiferrales bacterium]
MKACAQNFLLAIALVLSLAAASCAGRSAETSDPTAPGIRTQPINETASVGQTATFSVAASGTAPLSYQWKKNNTAITGATAASYTTPATTNADNGSTFAVVVSNTAGSITSNSATLTVTSNPTPPGIITQPMNETVSVGLTATFSVAASGTAPLSYQWKKNNTAITGATAASYTTPATTNADNGSTFAVVVSNTAGSITSNPATLTVTTGAPSSQLLTLSANGRYLINSFTGKPVFVVVDDAFDLAVMLNSAQVATYLNDRSSRGFNAIWVTAADNGYQPN